MCAFQVLVTCSGSSNATVANMLSSSARILTILRCCCWLYPLPWLSLRTPITLGAPLVTPYPWCSSCTPITLVLLLYTLTLVLLLYPFTLMLLLYPPFTLVLILYPQALVLRLFPVHG